MRDLERKIEKLERSIAYNQEEVLEILWEEDLHPLDKTRILVELGLLDGETLVQLIVEGRNNINRQGGDKSCS